MAHSSGNLAAAVMNVAFVCSLRGGITTHSTGARVSLPFMRETSLVIMVRRARLIRALDGFRSQ
jgi:hypothetical protein